MSQISSAQHHLQESLNQMPQRPLVVITWDGVSEPLQHIGKNELPAFDLLVFDYSGGAALPSGFNIKGVIPQFYSAKTECKGQIYQHAVGMAKTRNPLGYIGLIDDDIVVSIANLNRLIQIATEHNLDVFSASLTHDSIYSFTFMLTQKGSHLRSMPWIEVMMPFYRNSIIANGGVFFDQSISSWGIDKYAIQLLQRLSGMPKTAIIDSVAASHIRPITSRHRVYSNGLTAEQEAEQMRVFCLGWIRRHQPDWLSDQKFNERFEPDRRWSVRYKRLRAKLKKILARYAD
jgi:hypothetical protein